MEVVGSSSVAMVGGALSIAGHETWRISSPFQASSEPIWAVTAAQLPSWLRMVLTASGGARTVCVMLGRLQYLLCQLSVAMLLVRGTISYFAWGNVLSLSCPDQSFPEFIVWYLMWLYILCLLVHFISRGWVGMYDCPRKYPWPLLGFLLQWLLYILIYTLILFRV